MDTNLFRGTFFGCLVGDALGAPVEFKSRDTFPEVREMQPCLHFETPTGAFTDDGSMMLCLAAALVYMNGYHDPHTVLSHYMAWYHEGYMSATGHCFDIGRTTQMALEQFDVHGYTRARTSAEHMAGNGSLMRIAPIPLLFGTDEEMMWKLAVNESNTTHSNKVASWCCAVWSTLVAKALKGATKEKLLETLQSLTNVPESCERFPALEFQKKTRKEIESTGYVVHTMESALWAFFGTDTFEEGLIQIVNLGEDADTGGAVFGTLAGAFYGYNAIPSRWLDALQKREMVENVWTKFMKLCSKKWEPSVERQ